MRQTSHTHLTIYFSRIVVQGDNALHSKESTSKADDESKMRLPPKSFLTLSVLLIRPLQEFTKPRCV
ncbi:hypothetical protein H9L39_08494 [Fusarium oxysporum f. sp. albedinis]|nr:hypothetical protein H9L39_08494 [Fusarium oxysporum f. sp. albedinis]